MKIMFISDIHGSYTYAKKAIDAYKKNNAEKLVILGDILYHGPRNELPEGYNCKKVIELLNQYKDNIIAVRGNCDSEVDQMVLEFMMLGDYATIDVDGHHFFLTHGHLFDQDKLPKLKAGDVFVHGHYHVPMALKKDGIYIINPSSISLPKAGVNSFGLYENHQFIIKDFNNNIIKAITFE